MLGVPEESPVSFFPCLPPFFPSPSAGAARDFEPQGRPLLLFEDGVKLVIRTQAEQEVWPQRV